MHCNLKLSDVMPVILRFNIDADNVAAYKFKIPQPSRSHNAPAVHIYQNQAIELLTIQRLLQASFHGGKS